MKNKLHLYQSKPEDVPHNFWFYDMIKDSNAILNHYDSAKLF